MSKREILRREQERESLKMKRRKITYVAVGVLALSLIIFGTILAINKSRQGPAIETSQDTISKAIVSISKSVYDKVGPGSSELQVTKIGNKPDKDGKVKLFYFMWGLSSAPSARWKDSLSRQLCLDSEPSAG